MPAMCEEQSRFALIGTVKRNQELMMTTPLGRDWLHMRIYSTHEISQTSPPSLTSTCLDRAAVQKSTAKTTPDLQGKSQFPAPVNIDKNTKILWLLQGYFQLTTF